MAVNGLICAAVPLRNYLTQSSSPTITSAVLQSCTFRRRGGEN